MFTVYGQDNDITFFEGREDLRRCECCRQLLAKWDEDLSVVALPRRLKLDVSTSYDGVVVVSHRFREVYDSAGMTGLRFTPLGEQSFAVQAIHVVGFDADKRGTRFVDRCDKCGRFESVVGATPAILHEGAEVSDMGFARSDLEFGSGDEKSPLLICGDKAASALRKAKLKGMDLKAVVRRAPWRPRTGYRGNRYATLVWVTHPATQASLRRLANERDVKFVVGFLRNRLRTERERELASEVSYMVLVLSRAPREVEVDEFSVKRGGPVVEFGFGMFPAAPESWPSTTLRELLHAAIVGGMWHADSWSLDRK